MPERLVLIFTFSQRPINLTVYPLNLLRKNNKNLKKGERKKNVSTQPAQPRRGGDGPGRAPRCCPFPKRAGRARCGAHGLPRRSQPRLPGGCSQSSPWCLGLGKPVPPLPPPRGKSPAPPINFLMSREPAKASHPRGLNPGRIPTGTPMTDLFTVIVLLDNARFPRNFGLLGCVLFGNIFENTPAAPRSVQS